MIVVAHERFERMDARARSRQWVPWHASNGYTATAGQILGAWVLVPGPVSRILGRFLPSYMDCKELAYLRAVSPRWWEGVEARKLPGGHIEISIDWSAPTREGYCPAQIRSLVIATLRTYCERQFFLYRCQMSVRDGEYLAATGLPKLAAVWGNTR